MLIKFTNMGMMGEPIYINHEHITAIYEAATDRGSLTTRIWGGSPPLEWVIEESLEEAVKKVNEAYAQR